MDDGISGAERPTNLTTPPLPNIYTLLPAIATRWDHHNIGELPMRQLFRELIEMLRETIGMFHDLVTGTRAGTKIYKAEMMKLQNESEAELNNI